MNKRNHFKSRFMRVALMILLAVMTFPIKAWADGFSTRLDYVNLASYPAGKIPYIDENGKLHNDATGTTETTDDDCAEALPITSSNNDATYGISLRSTNPRDW